MGLRTILRIARWELSKNAGGIDRRTVAVGVLALALVLVSAPVVVGSGIALDEGLYRVSVDEDSRYHEVVADDDTFRIVGSPGSNPIESGTVELSITGDEITAARTAKGLAAHEELRNSIGDYNDRRLRAEDNATAAFPVSIVLEYVTRDDAEIRYGVGDGTSDATDGSDSGGRDDTAPGDPGGAGGEEGGDGGTTTEPVDPGGGTGALGGLGSALTGGDTSTGLPSEISPPFPFRSLLLAFVFVVPLNFLIQAYGSTILSERLNRRGELMLVSPVTRTDIIAGKTLPYFLAALGIESFIAVGLAYLHSGGPGGLVSIAAVVPLILLFLATTFLGAMFARSFKELTFVTVTITVVLTTYAFVPAIFSDVGEIALISPLTLVVRDLQGEAIRLGAFAFSTIPPTLTAVITFGLGAGLYREEDMFTQRSIPGKVLDALVGQIRSRWHVGLVTALLLPFVFVAELVAIAVLFALGELSIVLVLVFVAVVEEVAKSLHVYASFTRGRFDRGLRTALVLGALSGLGFFVAEKLTLLAQLVGLPELRIGGAAFHTAAPGEPVLVLFLLFPLALHATTAVVSAVGACRGRAGYAVGLCAAVLIHLAYNLTVVMALV